jgi:hypothetical protein
VWLRERRWHESQRYKREKDNAEALRARRFAEKKNARAGAEIGGPGRKV